MGDTSLLIPVLDKMNNNMATTLEETTRTNIQMNILIGDVKVLNSEGKTLLRQNGELLRQNGEKDRIISELRATVATLKREEVSPKRKRNEKLKGDVNVFVDHEKYDAETKKQMILEVLQHRDAYQACGISKRGMRHVLLFMGKSEAEIVAKCALCVNNLSRLSMACREITAWKIANNE